MKGSLHETLKTKQKDAGALGLDTLKTYNGVPNYVYDYYVDIRRPKAEGYSNKIPSGYVKYNSIKSLSAELKIARAAKPLLECI